MYSKDGRRYDWDAKANENRRVKIVVDELVRVMHKVTECINSLQIDTYRFNGVLFTLERAKAAIDCEVYYKNSPECTIDGYVEAHTVTAGSDDCRLKEDDMDRRRGEHPTMLRQVYESVNNQQHNTLIATIENGFDPNTPAYGKSCPLIVAVQNNDEQSVKILLSIKGIDVNSTYSVYSPKYSFCIGATALHYAAMLKDQSILNALLYAGADPHIKNAKGETPRDITPWKDTATTLERWESLTSEERACKSERAK